MSRTELRHEDACVGVGLELAEVRSEASLPATDYRSVWIHSSMRIASTDRKHRRSLNEVLHCVFRLVGSCEHRLDALQALTMVSRSVVECVIDACMQPFMLVFCYAVEVYSYAVCGRAWRQHLRWNRHCLIVTTLGSVEQVRLVR